MNEDDEARRRRLLDGSTTDSNYDPGALTFDRLKEAHDRLEALRPKRLIRAFVIREQPPKMQPMILDDPADGQTYVVMSRPDFDHLIATYPEDTAVDAAVSPYPTGPDSIRVIPLGVDIMANGDEWARGLFGRIAAQMAAQRYGHNIRFD